MGNGLAVEGWIAAGKPSYMSSPREAEMKQNRFEDQMRAGRSPGQAIADTAGNFTVASPPIDFSSNPPAAVGQMTPGSLMAVYIPTTPGLPPNHVAFILSRSIT